MTHNDLNKRRKGIEESTVNDSTLKSLHYTGTGV